MKVKFYTIVYRDVYKKVCGLNNVFNDLVFYIMSINSIDDVICFD